MPQVLVTGALSREILAPRRERDEQRVDDFGQFDRQAEHRKPAISQSRGTRGPMLERDLIPVPLQHQGRSGDGGELGQVDLRSGVMNTPAPDWSDERAVVDHLVLQARTFAGAGAFDEVSARAHAEAEVACTTDVQCAMTNIAFADHGPRWRERLGDITAPTLVLHGEDDPFFPIGNGEALAAEIPDARLVRLSRAGHRLPAHAVPIVAEELIAHTAG